MPLPPSRLPTAAGAWIFAGGFTLGVRKYFNILCHLEESNYGVATIHCNMPRLPIYVGQETWPLGHLHRRVDFLYGNPPCAAWSVAGYTKTHGADKWKTDSRVSCTRRHFQLLKELQPKVWAWESVTQAFTKGREFVDAMSNEALSLGYSVTYILHDASWLGLPQTRRRFFMVCHRIEFSPLVLSWDPPPTPLDVLQHTLPGKETHYGKEGTTFADRYNPLLPLVLPGERLVRAWQRLVLGGKPLSEAPRNPNGTVKGRPSFGHFRLPLDRPGNAIVGYGVIHPVEHRFLSTEELQALSGFPPNYIFTPVRTQGRASEIARGVCPPVGAWLARAVADAVQRDIPVYNPTISLVDYRKPPGVVTMLPYPAPFTTTELLPPPVPTTPWINHHTDKPGGCNTINTAPTIAARVAVTRPQGIGRYIRELILTGKYTSEIIIGMVRKRFPQSRATAADVAWNRGRLRKEGRL